MCLILPWVSIMTEHYNFPTFNDQRCVCQLDNQSSRLLKAVWAKLHHSNDTWKASPCSICIFCLRTRITNEWMNGWTNEFFFLPNSKPHHRRWKETVEGFDLQPVSSLGCCGKQRRAGVNKQQGEHGGLVCGTHGRERGNSRQWTPSLASARPSLRTEDQPQRW